MGGYHQLPIVPFEPQQSNPLQMLAGINQLKTAQLQQQGLQLENQTRQQDLATRQALNTAFASSVTKDEKGNSTFDPDKLQSALAAGPAAYKTPEVLEGITKFQQGQIDLKKSVTDLQQKSADMIGGAASAVKAAGYDPALAHSLLDQLPGSPQINQIRSQIDGNPQQFKQLIDSAIQQSPKQQEMQNQRDVAGIRANTPQMQTLLAYLKANPGKTPLDYQKYVNDLEVQKHVAEETNPDVLKAKKDLAVTTAQAEAPTKIATAGAEERQRQQIQGMVKPVYAIDAQSNNRRVPVSQTEALADPKRYSLITPVNEKDLGDDLQLNTRLSDVAQKISEYENSFAKDLPAKDKAIIAGAMGQGKFTLGGHLEAGSGMFPGLKGGIHGETPLDAINNLLQGAEENGLSAAAQQRLIAMRNAHEAMLGYKTVLSGSARGSDKQLDILNAALPSPVNSQQFAKEGFRQFKQNLTIAASRLPDFSRMGIQSPDDVVKSMSKPAASAPAPKTLSMQQIMQAAKDHNVSIGEAKRQAQAQGYTIQ